MNKSLSAEGRSRGYRARRWVTLRFAALALVLVLASAPLYAATGVLVFGDSLSAAHGMARDAGWVALLRQRLAASGEQVDVTNASISGETTAGGRSRLPAALARYRPAIVILELGGNDGLRALDVDAMQANLAAMIEASHKTGAKVLLLGMRIPANYGKAYSDRFHGVYNTLARRYGLAYVSFLLAPIALDRSRFQDDGIHPDAGAQPLLLAHIWSRLKPMLDDALSSRRTPRQAD